MKPAKPLRFLHVSTRYGLRVTSVSPLITEFVAKELPGEKLPRRWSDSVHPGPNKAPGITYRRAEPKPKRPGAARRARLATERGHLTLWAALVRRNTAKASIAP